MNRPSGRARRFSLLAALLVLLSGASARAVTLEACIGAALRQNPDVKAATERVEAARSALRAAHAAYYPQVGASATYARTDNAPQAFMMLLNQRNVSMNADFNNPDDTDNLALSLGVQYNLYDFGRRELDARMARDQSEIAGLVLQGLRNDLIHQVARGYYAVLQASAFTAVREETIRTFEESLRVARERLAAGGAVKSDVLNLDVQMAQARDDLIRARNGVALSIAALNTAIGVDMVGTNDMPVAMALPAARPVLDADRGLIQARPEYEAALLMGGILKAGVSKAQRQYAPVVKGFGSVDWNSGGVSDYERSYVVGVAAEVTLFDGFLRRSQITSAQAQERAAQDGIAKVHNELGLDLVTASLQAGEAWDRLDVARKSIESAEEALRITGERYRQGATDLPDLLTAQVGLSGTRTRNVAALYDCLTALSNLERARGNLAPRYPIDRQ